MARVPLVPVSTGAVVPWAQAFTQRYERDYAYLTPKCGLVSLSATVSNTIFDPSCFPQSLIFLTPATPEASQIQDIHVSSQETGQFVVTSTSVAAGCVFGYLIVQPATPINTNIITPGPAPTPKPITVVVHGLVLSPGFGGIPIIIPH